MIEKTHRVSTENAGYLQPSHLSFILTDLGYLTLYYIVYALNHLINVSSFMYSSVGVEVSFLFIGIY